MDSSLKHTAESSASLQLEAGASDPVATLSQEQSRLAIASKRFLVLASITSILAFLDTRGDKNQFSLHHALHREIPELVWDAEVFLIIMGVSAAVMKAVEVYNKYRQDKATSKESSV